MKSDYKGIIRSCVTNDILPVVEKKLVSLSVEIVRIPKEDMQQAIQQGIQQGIEQAFELFSQYNAQLAKKISVLSPHVLCKCQQK